MRLEPISHNVRHFRKLRGMTQAELAKAAGTTQYTVSEIELGHREPHPATLRKLAAALGVRVADFYGEAEVPKVPASPSPTQLPLNGFEEERRGPTSTQLEAIEDLKGFCDVLEQSVQHEWTNDEIVLANRLAMHAYMKVLALLAEDAAPPRALYPVASRFRDLALEYIRLIKDPDEELKGDLIHIDEYLERRRAS
jgi:transcriptional regulator with XRE-family HTH domain